MMKVSVITISRAALTCFEKRLFVIVKKLALEIVENYGQETVVEGKATVIANLGTEEFNIDLHSIFKNTRCWKTVTYDSTQKGASFVLPNYYKLIA